jgi:serine protease inhibitor
MKTTRITTALAIALLAAGLYTGISAKEKPATPPSKQAVDLATADNTFGLKLFKQLHKDGENTFISPLSISIAMQMARQGAGGDTRTEMDTAMGLGSLDVPKANKDLIAELGKRDGVKLSIANSLWADPNRVTMNEEYVKEVAENFDSLARTADFSDPKTVDLINEWISGKTNNLITKMLDKIPPEAIAYLINAIYFKGDWTAKFETKNTKDANFHHADGTTETVKMMSRKAEIVYGDDDAAQFAKLPYGEDEQAAMWVVLPKTGTSLDKLVTELDATKLKDWRDNAYESEGTLKLPRFKLRYKALLNDSLKELGIRKAFAGADFTRMGDSPLGPIEINRVLHEAVVIVNEEGTEAAAATIVEMKAEKAAPQPFSMICDRPFLFVITDEPTGAILFIGACYDPENE